MNETTRPTVAPAFGEASNTAPVRAAGLRP